MTVVVVGDVMDDVLVRVLGPVSDGSDTDSEILRAPGGSGANQAAWLGSLGVPVHFYGRVGAADVERHSSALGTFGVAAHLAADADSSTGTIVVLVGADGERTMLTDRGANRNLARTDLPASLEGAAHLHVSGYSLFDAGPAGAVRALVADAVRRSVPVSVDPSSESYLRALGASSFLARSSGASLCFPNAAEAVLLTGTTDPADAAAALCEHYETVVVKLGGGGAVVASRGARPEHVAAPAAVAVVDSTGAGDAFCGGFLAAHISGAPAVAAARAGAEAGARALGRLGARPAPG